MMGRQTSGGVWQSETKVHTCGRANQIDSILKLVTVSMKRVTLLVNIAILRILFTSTISMSCARACTAECECGIVCDQQRNERHLG